MTLWTRSRIATIFWAASVTWTIAAVHKTVAPWPAAGQQGVVAWPLDCDPSVLSPVEADQCRMRRRLEGKRLFEQETFGGNGRTCLTCHSVETGTIAPLDVQARLAADPLDPLFVHDGLDDGTTGTSRITEHATIRISLPLPAHLTLASDPAATHVIVNRAVLTTLNAPALDSALMWDVRDADLEAQALGAIRGHAQNLIEPTPLELELLAEFQQSPRFFSNGRLRKFAETGVPPTLPEGEI